MIDLIASDKQRDFGQAKRTTLPQYCLDCEVRFACHGGCPRNRFTTTPDGEQGLNYLCAGYKLFFNHIDPVMKQMSKLLNQGRTPSEVPALAAGKESQRYAWAGRNDPCPCGSGVKHKNCHG